VNVAAPPPPQARAATPDAPRARPKNREQKEDDRVAAVKPPGDAGGIAPSPTTPTNALTQREVEEWRNRYKHAWERRDVAALHALGAISAAQTDALKKALSRYETLHIAIANEEITLSGGQATLTFDRSDTDETGKTLAHPRQTFKLEKGPRGVVAVGRTTAGR
jgi:hypothetical protein